MFQKIFTREVKIGLLAVVCGFILFFGCNYLKGINIFNPMNCYFAKYENLGGLIVSSPVYIKGYKVGQVSEIRYDFTKDVPFIVTLDIDMDVTLPEGTVAELQDDGLLGGKCINLVIDNHKTAYAKSGDTLAVSTKLGVVDMLTGTLVPKVESAVSSADSLMKALNKIANSKQVTNSLNSVEKITSNLETTTTDLKKVVKNDVPKVMTDVDKAAVNLAKVGEKVNNLKIEETVDGVNNAVAEFNAVVKKINSSEGSAGMLLNDPSLYNNLTDASKNIDELIKDVKSNPKRYVHFSVFGKKDKKDK
jgi:phospholipid/cholesterol/gamma-HCH transport system substrate-binding protein